VRYAVLAPDVVLTLWKNEFARIKLDGTRQPLEQALMTLVWVKTAGGWRIRACYETTAPNTQAE
jgi:hypothetical protein